MEIFHEFSQHYIIRTKKKNHRKPRRKLKFFRKWVNARSILFPSMRHGAGKKSGKCDRKEEEEAANDERNASESRKIRFFGSISIIMYSCYVFFLLSSFARRWIVFGCEKFIMNNNKISSIFFSMSDPRQTDDNKRKKKRQKQQRSVE